MLNNALIGVVAAAAVWGGVQKGSRKDTENDKE